MGIFITLNKYKTFQSVKKVPTVSGDYFVSKITHPHNSVQGIYEEWDIPITTHR